MPVKERKAKGISFKTWKGLMISKIQRSQKNNQKKYLKHLMVIF